MKIPCSVNSGKWILVILVCLAILGACRNERAVDASEELAPAMPSIKLIAPHSNDEWYGDQLVLNVEVQNFVLDPDSIGQAAVPGTGHIHVIIDGDKAGISPETTIVVEGVAPGPHHVMVQLANNDHSPVYPLVEDSIILNVLPAQRDKQSENSSIVDESPSRSEMEPGY